MVDLFRYQRYNYGRTATEKTRVMKEENLYENSQQAILGNESNYTVFRAGDKVIRFRAPYSLEHYTEVKEWDHGYIVAMAKYKQNDRPEEEYIDLIPILKKLYFDPETFLAPIKEVRVANG